jgi:hypothetical protein
MRKVVTCAAALLLGVGAAALTGCGKEGAKDSNPKAATEDPRLKVSGAGAGGAGGGKESPKANNVVQDK